MKRTVISGLALCALCIFVGFVYGSQILPIVVYFPFSQDFAQDYVGARALINKTDELYPVLGPAFKQIGIDWNVLHRSTHPPTTFLLALPFALLKYKASQILWMAAMFACIVITIRLMGLAWGKSILVGILSLAWPPTIWSLYQFTPIWLLGLVLAYKFRHRPFTSGVFIALASLPKFLAAPTLLYHLRRRQWASLVGFAALWLGVLCLLLLLRTDSLTSYISSNIGNTLDQIHRLDNCALVAVAWDLGGWIGIAACAALILWVLWSGLRSENPAGWGCLVWLGIALLPIAWVYSLLPLLPWLVLTLLAPGRKTRMLAGTALLLPYFTAYPGGIPYAVTMSIALSGIAFALASVKETQQIAKSPDTCTQPTSLGIVT